MYSMKKVLVTILNRLYYKRRNINCRSMLVPYKFPFGHGCNIRENTEVSIDCTIGNNTYIGRNCSLTKASVGHYCSIANNVSIGQGEHDLYKISTSSIFYDDSYGELTKRECIIGNDVWIGVGVTVLRGVKIGNGAVIGANCVVTKNIPPYAVVVGVPGKIIKYRFPQEKISKIDQSKWWKESVSKAKTIIKEMD